LFERFPALAEIPRISLGRFPTPIAPLTPLSTQLWIKRDDLCADPLGGNKVRALEFLLGGVAEEDELVTIGSAGSTHALALAFYGNRLKAKIALGLWHQEMNSTSEAISERLLKRGTVTQHRSPVSAYLWALVHRLRGSRWIAPGGSSPVGVLGHVNAGLELVEQIEAGILPQPSYVVVPLGTGGTAAGLALAFAIAGRDITVVGVRVVPKIVARKSHVLSLASRASKLISSYTGTKLPRVKPSMIDVVHSEYGGAYGRETQSARAASLKLDQLRSRPPLALDGSYSAKAFAHALGLATRKPTLFWLTFDSRILNAR
jgi:1-aminocyclopropane-1-carboxylate deaminase/D-cysteine desulfhydrase-like pyridoxal-dependent ACC family enzyme